MKNNFINSLVLYLIERDYYNPISTNNETLDFGSEPACLIKNFQGTTVLVEIIDADKYSCEQMTRSMENGAAMLNNINGSNASVFKIFLFNNTPDNEKLNIIEQLQMDLISEKKFLKAISVDIMAKQVSKHFSAPAFDAHLVKLIKRFFSKNLDARQTSPHEIYELLEHRKKDYEIQIKAKKPVLTYILVFINILVWAVLKLISMKTADSYDSLLEPFGAKVNRLILEGEYWRFFTPMFLHGDEIHLAVNCYSLYIVGSQVEKLYGHIKFSFIYIISGILGCIASFAFSVNPSVGASGAIFGLLGAMLYFALKRPSLLKSSFGTNLISTLVINLAYGFMNPRIDNYGHIGGLIGGLFTTGVVYTAKDQKQKEGFKKLAALILLISITIGGLMYGFNNTQNVILPKITTLQNYEKQNNWSDSEKLAEEILALKPSDKNTKIIVLWTLTRSEAILGKYQESIEHAKQLKAFSPEDGHYLLGVVYYDTKQYDLAKEELLAAKKLSSAYTESIDQLLADINSR